ncbi:protein-tyrosine phosphatase-like protein [Chytriomyces sp. MP71]|nr:protein-tyrosine phosphatase-like protein [Chytriomyces sp. MP71]
MPARLVSARPMNRTMTEVAFKHMRFIVFDAPTDSNAHVYFNELQTRNVSDVVRLCEPTYDAALFESNGIKVTDLPFTDGAVAPAHIIRDFIALCNTRFGPANPAAFTPASAAANIPAIGIHCVAGLGRAPMLVAIALVEAGMQPFDAVEYVRERRRGAFNTVQLNYLINDYRRIGSPSPAHKGALGSLFWGAVGLTSAKPVLPSPEKKAKRSSLTPSLDSGDSSVSVEAAAPITSWTSFDVALSSSAAAHKAVSNSPVLSANGGLAKPVGRGFRWWFNKKAVVA